MYSTRRIIVEKRKDNPKLKNKGLKKTIFLAFTHFTFHLICREIEGEGDRDRVSE